MLKDSTTPNLILSIIIVSYNTAELTAQTLQSVFTATDSSPLLKQKTEVLVIDNNSTDNSVAQIKKFQQTHTFLKLIQNNSNGGFARANNQGIEQSRGKYVLLLNSDTIVAPEALEVLVSTFETVPYNDATAVLSTYKHTLDNLGILAATLYNPDGSLQPQGGSLPSIFTLISHMLFLDDLPLIGRFFPSTQHTGRRHQRYSNTTLVEKDWVAGTAMMVKHSVFSEIGLLDENIFMYGEDIEFCLRAKHHHYDIAIHPQAAITHIQSASSSPAKAIIGEFNGYLYIFAKHKPTWQLPIARAILRVGAYLRLLLFGTITQNTQRSSAYSQALREL
jgi:GT2 family glycosyltransferase